MVEHTGYALRWSDQSYSLTGGKEVRWVSWSVAKSFVSALVGIAIEQGAISIDDPISDYWPDMKGKGKDRCLRARAGKHKSGQSRCCEGTIGIPP